MFMNERNSGTAHITAALEAFAKSALTSEKNCVFDFGNKFAATVTPATGEVTVMSGVMSWGGRMAGIKNTESVSYTPPNSETLFKKVVVCAQYSKNTETSVESIQLAVLESENQPSESAANALNIDTGSGEITAATEAAYFPLWSFVATSISATSPIALFSTVPGIAQLNNILTAVNKALTQEIADRKTAVSSEASARVKSHNDLVGDLKTTNANVSANTKAIENLNRKNILLARNLSGIESQTFNYNITDFSMLAIRYNIAGLGDTKYMVIPTFARGDIDGSTNTYSITENNRVVSKGTLGGVDIDVQGITIQITVSSEKFIVNKSGSSTTKMIEIVGIY
ncbi:MAG: hypothetical protein IJA02_08950 [Clostridia bacterium]|nr:hypothetical protein [Clostridia bacterium]